MQKLTPEGQQKINDIAQQYDVSTDAVMTLLQALLNGNGTMAQFNHPELGGSGQWMQGGMTMVGDMFNNNLKAKVDGICVELSNILANQKVIYEPPKTKNLGGQQQQQGIINGSGNWWPSELGMPTASGAQNNMRYAYFSDAKRLAIEIDGQMTLFDTLDHQIGGVSQQQGAGTSLSFSSQYGTVDVWSLPIVSGTQTNINPPADSTGSVMPSSPTQSNVATPAQDTDILSTLERLAELKEKGIITEEEFAAKKAELLNRL
jgi:hypothetical protein